MSSNTSAPANSDPAVPTNPPCPCTRSSATPTDAAAVFQAAPTPAQTSPRPAEGLQPTPPQSAHQRPNTRQLQAFLNTTFYRYTALVPRHLLCTFCKMVPSDPVQCRTCSNLFCARCWSARYPFPLKCACADKPSSPPVKIQQADREIRNAISQLEVICNRCE